jgi:hypothetical protein
LRVTYLRSAPPQSIPSTRQGGVTDRLIAAAERALRSADQPVADPLTRDEMTSHATVSYDRRRPARADPAACLERFIEPALSVSKVEEGV